MGFILDIYQDDASKLELGQSLDTVNLSVLHCKDKKKILVNVHPMKLSKQNGYTSKEYMVFEENNFSVYMIDMPRASDKKFQQIAGHIKENLDKIWELYNRGVNPNKGEIARILWGFNFS